MNIPDPESLASKYFKWKELLWLPTWDRYATEQDGLTEQVLTNLTTLARKMDLVRELLSVPIMVHSAYRPPAYNQEVKGAPDSPHLCLGDDAAMDFHPYYETDLLTSCQKGTRVLFFSLEQLGLRMENNGLACWIHLDTRTPKMGYPRYFRP